MRVLRTLTNKLNKDLQTLTNKLTKVMNTRYIVALFAIILVAFRAIWPNFVYDDTSFYLTLLAALVLLIPDIGDTIARIKKFKKGDWEIEFDGRMTNIEKVFDSKVEPDIETDKDNILSDESGSLSNDELQILKIMAESVWLLRSAGGLTKELNFTSDKTDKLLKALTEKDYVSVVHRKTGGVRWTLTEQGQQVFSQQSNST